MAEANSINAATTGIVGNTGTAFTGTAVTQHAVQVGGSTSSTLTQLAVGTTGQVLVAATSADPGWQNPSSVGSWVFLSSQTAANVAAISFVTGISSTYNTYKVVMSNVAASAVAFITCQISTNGGSSYIATNYQSGSTVNQYNATTWSNSNATTYIKCSPSMTNTATDTLCGELTLSDLSSGAETKSYVSGSAILAATAYYFVGQSFNTNTSQVNAIQFATTSGNIKTGKFSLYGLVES